MKMLFASYRLDQYPDPDGFVAQVGLVMSEYSEEAVIYATDPRWGIQSKHKWPPVIAEIIESMNAAVAIVEGDRLRAECKAAGFFLVNDPADNRVGFYNSEGVNWHDRHKPRALPAPPADPEKVKALAAGLRLATAEEKPAHEPREHTDHGRRIKEDLEFRTKRSLARGEVGAGYCPAEGCRCIEPDVIRNCPHWCPAGAETEGK